MSLYMLMSLKSIQWEMLLVIICGYYLDAKVRNFMLMYVAFVSMSLLFDVVDIASMDAYETMTAGEQFSSTIFLLIFLLKFCILGTIYFYERDLDSHPEGYFRQAPTSLRLKCCRCQLSPASPRLSAAHLPSPRSHKGKEEGVARHGDTCHPPPPVHQDIWVSLGRQI